MNICNEKNKFKFSNTKILYKDRINHDPDSWGLQLQHGKKLSILRNFRRRYVL